MAKDLYAYQAFLRPNFESWAASVWLLSGVTALLFASITELPPTPLWVIAAIALVMAISRGRVAMRNRRVQKRLGGSAIEFVTHKDIRKQVAQNPDQVWLGEGFEWGNAHIQRAQEILNQDSRRYLPKAALETGGAQWLHGLEYQKAPVRISLDTLKGHTLIAGTTRAGKSVMFRLLISQCIGRNEPVIIIDPKGDPDMLAETRRACAFHGRSFKYLHPAFPQESVRINLLRNFSRGTDLAGRIASIIPTESGADPFVAFGHMALNNVVQGLLLIDKRPTLVSIRQQLEQGPDELVIQAVGSWATQVKPEWVSKAAPFLQKANTSEKKAQAMVKFYREQIRADHPNQDLEGLISMQEHNREHFQKMIASLLPVLAMLTSSELGPLFSPRPGESEDARSIVNLTQIIEGRSVLYVGLNSMSDAQVGGAIGALIMADLAAVGSQRYSYGMGEMVNIFVDEASEAANVPFTQVLNKGGGAKLRMFVATQAIADFASKLGSQDKALQLLGNLNNVISLRVLDEATRDYVTNNLPTTRYKYVMRTQATSNDGSEPLMSSGNQGERLMEEETDLFPSQLLTMLPNLEYLARLADGRIIKGRIPILMDEQDK